MLKIKINDQDIKNEQTIEALVRLLYLVNQSDQYADGSIESYQKAKKTQHIEHKVSKQNYTFICPQSHEIGPWSKLLKLEQQRFIHQLQAQGQLTIEEVADILDIQSSSKNLKKHVNGSIGSILRWTKVAFLQSIYTGDLSKLDFKYTKLLPPWYCDQGIYYWRILDRE